MVFGAVHLSFPTRRILRRGPAQPAAPSPTTPRWRRGRGVAHGRGFRLSPSTFPGVRPGARFFPYLGPGPFRSSSGVRSLPRARTRCRTRPSWPKDRRCQPGARAVERSARQRIRSVVARIGRSPPGLLPRPGEPAGDWPRLRHRGAGRRVPAPGMLAFMRSTPNAHLEAPTPGLHPGPQGTAF